MKYFFVYFGLYLIVCYFVIVVYIISESRKYLSDIMKYWPFFLELHDVNDRTYPGQVVHHINSIRMNGKRSMKSAG